VVREVPIERDYRRRVALDFDTLWRVREVPVRERDGRRRAAGEIHRRGDVTPIDARDAGARITHAAYAIGVCGARAAIALKARASTIDTGFRAILNAIVTGRCGAFIHGIAIRAHAVAVAKTGLTVDAIGARRTTAIDVGFGSILDHVHTCRCCAGHHGIAICAFAISAHHAALAVHA